MSDARSGQVGTWREVAEDSAGSGQTKMREEGKTSPKAPVGGLGGKRGRALAVFGCQESSVYI